MNVSKSGTKSSYQELMWEKRTRGSERVKISDHLVAREQHLLKPRGVLQRGPPRGPRGTWRAGAGASRRWGRGAAWAQAEGVQTARDTFEQAPSAQARPRRNHCAQIRGGTTTAARPGLGAQGAEVRFFAPPDCVRHKDRSTCPAPAGGVHSEPGPASVHSRALPSPLRHRSGSARHPGPPPPSVARRRRCHPLLGALSLPGTRSRPAPGRPCSAGPPRPLSPPLSPLVWPPGRGGREQPEEEPQPGGGGPSPWRTVKEAARRKCATTMTVGGPGTCGGAAGRARRGGGRAPPGALGGCLRGQGHGLPGFAIVARGCPPALLLSGPPHGHAEVWGALLRAGPRGSPVGTRGLTAQSRRPGAPPRVPVPSPARPVPHLGAGDLSALRFQPHPGPRRSGGAAEELLLAGGQVRRAALSRSCLAWTPSLAFVRRVL